MSERKYLAKVKNTRKIFERNNIIPILEYVLWAFGIPTICVLLCKLNRNHVSNFILYGIEGASPTLAVIIVVFLHNKKNGLIKYLHDKYILNLSLHKCFLAFLIPFVILSCAKIMAIIMRDIFVFPALLTVRRVVIIFWALIAEELGWRGYLQDKLEVIISHKCIPFFTGIIWALWHYHFILLGSLNVPIVAFTLGCVFESYGYFTITKLAKNNIVPASIWHFTGNMMFNLYRFDPQWHNGNTVYYWIVTVFYAVNIMLFALCKKDF